MAQRVDPPSKTPRAPWALLLALAALAGCQPPAVNTPATPAPVATLSQATPTADPVTTAESSNPPVTASPSLDSDLEADDAGAIQNVMDTDQLIAYLPSDLIHDGGVILFRTLATQPSDGPTVTVDDPPAAPAAAPAPQLWKRSEVQSGGRQLRLRKLQAAPDGSRRADVNVSYPMSGTFSFRDTAHGLTLRKTFHETFQRQFEFRLRNNAWQLAQVSPIHIESQGGNSGLDVNAITLYAGDDTTPIEQETSLTRRIAPDAMPVLAPTTALRVELVLKKRAGTPAFVYMHLVGGAGQSKHALPVTGTTAAGDTVYSGKLMVPATTGLYHLGLDVLDPVVFAPGGLYRSNAFGLSFRVKKANASPAPSAGPAANDPSAVPSWAASTAP